MDINGLSRRTVIKLTAGGSVVSLAGCLGGDGDGDEDDDVEEVELGEGDITLEFSGWGEGVERQAVEDMLESFANQNEDVGVQFQHVPEDFEDRLRTQFGAGEEPDVFYMPMEYVGEFEEVLVDLEPELDDELLNDLDEPVVEAATLPEGVHFIPKDFQYNALIHNTEMLSNAGYDEMPETWEEFRAMLEAIAAEGEVEYPLVEWNIDGHNSLAFVFMHANGGQVMNEDNTECVIDSPENVEALEYLQGLREDGLMGLESEVAADAEHAMIGEEQTAMLSGGGWIFAELKSDYEEIDEVADIAAMPIPEGGEQTVAISCVGYSVSANSEHPEESLALVEYLMGDGIFPWLETGIALSIRESHREEVELYDEDERYERWFEMGEFENVIALQYGPDTSQIVNTIYPQLEGIYQGEVEPADAVTTIEEEVNNNILN